MQRLIGTILLLLTATVSVAQAQDFLTQFAASKLRAAPAKLIPFPQELYWEGEYVRLNGVSIEDRSPAPALLHELAAILEANELSLQVDDGIVCHFVTSKVYAKEAYEIEISKERIRLAAATETGHFYALQTLRQLIQTQNGHLVLPLCVIRDAPAFPIRGFMIDVGRNFQSIASLKRQLDIMARYKLNVFQWHLTDRPAWRIESKRYPQLTAAKHHRPTRNPGQFYSYADIRALIQYARERHIRVIPEIDMPGHSDAFTKAMGVKMESTRGMEVLEDILAEFFAEIPVSDCPILHIGSDEVKVPNPRHFMDRMVAFGERNGRQIMIWNPGLPANDNVIRQTWKPDYVGSGNYQEVDSWNSYINNGEPLTQVQRLFFKPIGDGSPNEVIGGILCLWPDVNLEQEEDAYTQNPVYPSLLTYAWRTWTADLIKAPTTYFMTLPQRNTVALEYFAAFEAILLHHKKRYFADQPFPYTAQADAIWRVIGPFNGDDGDQVIRQDQNAYPYQDTLLQWKTAIGNTIVIKDRFALGGHYPDAKQGETYYAKTYIYADSNTTIPTWIGFETPMRSNRTYTGIPPQGSWDPNGGNIWINNQPLQTPNWGNPGWKPSRSSGWGSAKDQETPWRTEELYWTRPPVDVPLKKGWNSVMVKIPGGSSYQNWMFTFAPLTTKGLRFAPSPTLHSTYYQQRKTHFKRLPKKKGGIIFIGDSIIDGCEWNELLKSNNIQNRGISGDVTQGVLDRLVDITTAQPSKVFLLIGTNDLARGISPEQVVKNIERIVWEINLSSPSTEVYVHSLLPVNDHYGMFSGHTRNGEKIRVVNAALTARVSGTYQFIDLHKSLRSQDGKLDIRFTNDGLHLNGEGYARWAMLLKPHIN